MKDIKYSIEIMQEEIKNKYISPEIKYAFEASIKALKKEIDKGNCNYCNNGNRHFLNCKVMHEDFIDGCSFAGKPNFCPVCGRDLKEENNDTNKEVTE